MSDFLTAFGLLLVIEGVIWAASPGGMKRAAALAQGFEDGQLRRVGLIVAAVGLALVWLIRG